MKSGTSIATPIVTAALSIVISIIKSSNNCTQYEKNPAFLR